MPAARAETAEPREADIEQFRRLSTALRDAPAAFASTSALARAAGSDGAALETLLREHAHRTASDWLKRRRTHAACRMLGKGGTTPADAAMATGFRTAAALERACRTYLHSSPEALQALGSRKSFSLTLPARYRAADVLAYHARDPQSLCENVRAQRMLKALLTRDGPVVLEISIDARHALCRVRSDSPVAAVTMREMHGVALRMLGLTGDVAAFEKHARADPRMQALVARRRGLRLPLAATAFDGLCWAIVGQQINVAFASALRRDMIELLGPKVHGMRAHPTPEQIAALDVADLTRRRFSRAKAEYLLGAARAIGTGELPLDAMADDSAVAAQTSLTAIRGIGIWTARYVLMRGLGFADCAPVGDVALAAALKHFTGAAERPSHAAVEVLMRPFSPHRSLATFHLWASLKDRR